MFRLDVLTLAPRGRQGHHGSVTLGWGAGAGADGSSVTPADQDTPRAACELRTTPEQEAMSRKPDASGTFPLRSRTPRFSELPFKIGRGEVSRFYW